MARDEPCATSPPGNKLPSGCCFVSKTPASDVDLNRVAVFLRVVELQSFTAAADVLGLPKSSVSRSVARLEESLGVQLLQRTTRAIQLTEAGRLYFEQASRALSELEQAHEALSRLDAKPQGTGPHHRPPGSRGTGAGAAGGPVRAPDAGHHPRVHPHRPAGEPGRGGAWIWRCGRARCATAPSSPGG
jgi:molybdenum-dependent DNA-binding transcriptional regulator ModE